MAELQGKTFNELKEMFEVHTGGTVGDIDDAGLAVWFNEAQLDLAIELGLPALPALLSGVDGNAVCELPPILHDLLPLFAASRAFDQESEGDQEESMHANKWMGYYERGKQQRKMQLNLSGKPKPERWVVLE